MTYFRFTYEVVLDFVRDNELIQVVTDNDGSGYVFNHDKGTFYSISDWHFLNSVDSLLKSLEPDKGDWVSDMDSELINSLYEDVQDFPEEKEIFWRMFWLLHLDRFNQDIADKFERG